MEEKNFEQRSEEILFEAKKLHQIYTSALANLEQTNRIEFVLNPENRKPCGFTYKQLV